MALKILSDVANKDKQGVAGSSDETYVVIDEFYQNKVGNVQAPVRYFKSQEERMSENGWDKNVKTFLKDVFTFKLEGSELIHGIDKAGFYAKIKTELEADGLSVETV